MGDSLKYIVSELKKDPFKRNYSLISFDSLEGLSLLQVLTDVLAEIEPNQRVDVREESAEGTVARIFNMLHIFKYTPDDMDVFRQGLVEGSKAAIHPLLSWLLRRVGELKERAYLARYLVKVNVPPEFLSDGGVADVYEQYVGLMESFKGEHREMKGREGGGFGTEEVKRDIRLMQSEMEQVLLTIDKLKKKVDGLPNKEAMLSLSKKIRTEADHNNKMHIQKQGQRNLIMQTEQKVERQQKQLKERRQANIGISNESLYTRLVEETKTNKYLANEKIPQEVKEVRALTNDIQRISVEPAIDQSYLDDISFEMKAISTEVNRLSESKMNSDKEGNNSGGEMYRQQASIVRNKKELVGDRFRDIRSTLARLEEEYEEKRSGMGEGVVDHEKFRRLATSMRSMQGRFKGMKAVLSGLKLENNHLERTQQLLEAQIPTLKKQLELWEGSKGVHGYHDVQDALENVSSGKSELDSKKGKTMQDNSLMVQQLNNLIERRKAVLAPILQQLKPLRLQCQEMSEGHRGKKEEYDSHKQFHHATWTHLQQEVTSHTDAINSDESNIHYTKMLIKSMDALVERSENEKETKAPTEKSSFRDVLSRKIAEAEQQSRQLKEKQNDLTHNEDSTAAQAKTWVQLEKIMQTKIKIASGDYRKENESESKVTTRVEGSNTSNRLIL